MKILKPLLLILFITGYVFASEHGIYLQIVKNSNKNLTDVTKEIEKSLTDANYLIKANHSVATPDYINEEKENLAGFKANLLVLTSTEYISFLNSVNSKYHVGSMLKVGIYENKEGVQVVISDPETINRILFNDIYDDGEEEKYNELINETKKIKQSFISVIHSLQLGENVNIPKEPIRSDEDLAEASKDMFMMVGPMTYFADEDQFPLIYTVGTRTKKAFLKIKETLLKNISEFEPLEDDVDYRWTPSENDLKWNVISEIINDDTTAITLGLTRKRTEAVSFRIVGGDDENSCRGLDHVCAYPVEVLLLFDGTTTKIYTQREMFRMDMYFWDAGMAAFMDHMSMPGILDESIKKALFGKAYTNN